MTTAKPNGHYVRKVILGLGPMPSLHATHNLHYLAESWLESLDMDESVSSARSSTRTLRSDAKINSTDNDDEIEVEVAQKSLKVSKDAWKSFQVYRQYSDWSSETEKTDYTYSRLSSYRDKEIFPGFPVRPNLCRSPIHSRSPASNFSSSYSEVTSQNNHNKATYNFERNLIDDDDDSESYEESLSFYERFLLFFTTIWTVFTSAAVFCKNKLQSVVELFSSLLVGSSVYIWTKTAAALSFISLSTLHLRQRLFTRNYAEDDVSSDYSENLLTVIVRRRVSTAITTIRTIYRNAFTANSAASSSKVKYLWLLLLPLLFISALYYYSINPATIVLSLILQTYGVIIESPNFIYESIINTFNVLLNLNYCSLPGFITTTLPSFITQNLYSLYACVSYYIASLINLVHLGYFAEIAYQYLIFLFSYFSIQIHNAYVWVWSITIFMFSSAIWVCSWVSNSILFGFAFVYDTILGSFINMFSDLTVHNESGDLSFNEIEKQLLEN